MENVSSRKDQDQGAEPKETRDDEQFLQRLEGTPHLCPRFSRPRRAFSFHFSIVSYPRIRELTGRSLLTLA